MPRNQRLALLGLAALVAVVAIVLVASSGGGSGSPRSSASSPVKITVRNEKPVGGLAQINVKQGDPVRFTVTADKADEIHVHGYDVHKDVPAHGSVSFDFPARIDGIFVIELEGPGVQIASLKVSP